MSAPVQVGVAQEGDAALWNKLVEAHANGSTFHRYEWRGFYQRVYGHEAPYLVARRAGVVTGVLPLVRVKSLVFGHYLVSLPYVSYGGPLGDAESETALAEYAAGMANGARLVELRTRAAVECGLKPVSRKVTVLLDLVPGDYEATFKGFSSKLRSQVRRAGREGMRVEFGHHLIPAYHRVFAEHMRDLGSPAHGEKFFAELAAVLGERAWVGVGWLGEEPVACGFAIENGREVEISWASSLRRHQKIAPNMALYGAFIERACERGFEVFNFGRCTPGSGTHKFKQQWGTRDEELTWLQAGPRAASEADSSTPTPDAGLYHLATRVWQKLPLGVTTRVGARVIAGIP